MTNRERMLAIMDGKSPDQIPWIPRLQIWHRAHQINGTLPERYKDWDLRDIERDLGMGTPAKGGHVYRTKVEGVEMKTHKRGSETLTEYITPVGTVTEFRSITPELERVGLGARAQDHMIKKIEDYDVVAYMVEHTEYIPTYEEYMAYEEEVGEDGVPLVSIGDCPMNRILRESIGYNDFYFELHDHTDKVESLAALMAERDREMWKIVAESPASLVQHGSHFDSIMTPPPLFDQYFKSYYQEFSKLLHSEGKTLSFHADADTKLLLRPTMEAGFDMGECFTTAPMVPCTLAEAREVWENNVIIWGGLPSTMLCDPTPEKEFEGYMMMLFQTIAPGDHFVLGVADNVMPEARFDRIVRVGQMVEEYGKYPIRM